MVIHSRKKIAIYVSRAHMHGSAYLAYLSGTSLHTFMVWDSGREARSIKV